MSKRVLIISLLPILFSGCSLVGNQVELSEQVAFRRSGLLSISRFVPSTPEGSNSQIGLFDGSKSGAGAAEKLLGFAANTIPELEKRGVFSLSNKLAVLPGSNQNFPISADPSVQKGVFTVVRVDSNPLWEAPDSYFLNRHQALPDLGSNERLRRGALGDYAVHLDSGAVIHTGDALLVGGIGLPSDLSNQLQQLFKIGASIEVVQ